jgi:iron-regulated transporter 1
MSSPTPSPADSGSPNNSEPESIDDVLTPPVLESFPDIEDYGMTRSQAFNLYTTHFLSTWNVRSYEFAAVSADQVTGTREEADCA